MGPVPLVIQVMMLFATTYWVSISIHAHRIIDISQTKMETDSEHRQSWLKITRVVSGIEGI
jgi:hypothetical protein